VGLVVAGDAKVNPLNPLDFLTDAKKDRLIDAGLTKVADAAEKSGAARLAQALRNLRNDTPFIEDVAGGLQKALIAFSVEWGNSDPEVVSAIQQPSIWESTEILSDLATILLSPAEIRGPEFDRMSELITAAAPGGVNDRVTVVLEWLISKAREELFTHPKLQGVHSLYLQAQAVDRQVDILEELRAIHRDNTVVLSAIAPKLSPESIQAISGSSKPPPQSISGHPAWNRTFHRGELPGTPLPDVLTPSVRGSGRISLAYEPVIGTEGALWLEGIQSDITRSIETADFVMQEKIVERLLENDFGIASIKACSYYMLGESKRLQADFVKTEPERVRLLAAAADAYSAAWELDPASARSQRGLGRVHEVSGDLGKALKLYARARASALNAFEESGEPPSSEAAHEVLRSTRHYASCVAQRIRTDQQGAAARDSNLRQLHGVILESDELHRSILPRFAAQSHWTFIEWFMGLVLLAKSYAVVQDFQRSWLSLLYALSARMGMMDPVKASFSDVERGNLTWWCDTAKSVKVSDLNFRDGVERLAESVLTDNVSVAWINMQDLVWPVRPPWSQHQI